MRPELFAAVCANPEADAPREVLADALQELGDPRGEFIALQLREARGETELADRAQALLDRHKHAWFGSVRALMFEAKVRRGFLHELVVNNTVKEVAATEPELGTITELAQTMSSIPYAALLTALAPRLTTITVEGPEAFEVFEATEFPNLRSLQAKRWNPGREYGYRFADHLLPLVAALPNLTTLGCSVPMLPFVEQVVLPRLAHLSLSTTFHDLRTFWRKYPWLSSLGVTGYARVELVRREGRELARVYAGALELEELADALPETVREIEVQFGEPEVIARFAAQHAGRFTLTAIPNPSGDLRFHS